VCVIIVISLHIERISLAAAYHVCYFTYIIADPIITSVLHLQFIMDRELNKQTNYAPLSCTPSGLSRCMLTNVARKTGPYKQQQDDLFLRSREN
jgi:hypothetical protein